MTDQQVKLLQKLSSCSQETKNKGKRTQKDYLNDLLDALDSDEQESEADTSELEDNQVISNEGEIIELDF